MTILAILSTTSFVILSKWFLKARNSRRIVDIQNIQNALESYYYTKKALNESGYQYPIPGKFVEIYTTSWELLGLEWVFDESVTSQMKDVLKTPKDPSDKNYYGYAIYHRPIAYEIVAFFEFAPELAMLSKAYAFELQTRYPMVVDNVFDTTSAKIRPLSFIYSSTGIVTSELLGAGGAIHINPNHIEVHHLKGKKVGGVRMNQGTFKIPLDITASGSKVDELDLTQLKSVGKVIVEKN